MMEGLKMNILFYQKTLLVHFYFRLTDNCLFRHNIYLIPPTFIPICRTNFNFVNSAEEYIVNKWIRFIFLATEHTGKGGR